MLNPNYGEDPDDYVSDNDEISCGLGDSEYSDPDEDWDRDDEDDEYDWCEDDEDDEEEDYEDAFDVDEEE